MVFSFIDVDNPLRHVDVFLTAELGFTALAADAVEMPVEGRMIRLASVRCLLELKRRIQPPRPKDRQDIEELQRLLEKADEAER